jgi:hypothetical protein
MRLHAATAVGMIATVFTSATAMAQGDTLRHDSASVAATAALTAPTAPIAPSFVGDFEMAGEVSLPAGTPGHWYRYVHDKIDTIDVDVAPYPAGIPLRTNDDSAGFAFAEADRSRYNYDQAYRTGVLSAYRLTGARTDPVHVRGVPTHGYLVEALFKRRNSGVARYAFYAVYAVPQGAVRIHAELPTYRGSTGTLVNFSHGFLDALVAANQ